MGLSSIFEFLSTNPKSFGVIEFDKNHNITNIIEKPKFTKSNIIVSGLYFYTNDVIKYAKQLEPSYRGRKRNNGY